MADEKATQNKLKNGELRVGLEDEEIIWKDRKRVTIFALPWSFTQYSLTASRLFIKKGFINYTEGEVRLYRIKDITYTQSLGERIGGTGTLKIISTDATTPALEVLHIKNARKVKDVLSQAVEVSRRENGVRASEIIGGAPGQRGGGALGPEIFPDADGDGIDDREQ